MKNSTLEMVRPEVALAVAVMSVAVLTVSCALAAGAEIDTVGAVAALTVTATAADVATALVESVTFAVKLARPMTVGVHAKAYGDVVSVPNKIAPLKNSTLVIVRPLIAVALALSVLATLTVSCALAAGAVKFMVGALLAGPTST